MRVNGWMGIFVATFLLLLAGCEKETGPDLTGEITLSSQLHGTATEGFYIYGYAFEQGEMYSYSYFRVEEPLPDIINEGYPLIEDGKEISLPGFNTPGRVNGFALVGEFSTWDDAYDFYINYDKVEDGLHYETVSDFVELYQVWVQQTAAGNYVRMVVKDIQHFESETGDPYNDVSLQYTYALDGSMEFSCGCN